MGQNVNSYNYEAEGCNNMTFPGLLNFVAGNFPTMRIRFTTSHPKDMCDETLEVMAKHNNICKFIHLPLQSGSSKILKLMNRKYDREWTWVVSKLFVAYYRDADYQQMYSAVSIMKQKKIHQETLSLMKWAGYDSAFMFKYSERPGTYAAKNLEDNVPEAIKGQRLQEIN